MQTRLKTEPVEPLVEEVRTEVPCSERELQQSPADIKREIDECTEEKANVLFNGSIKIEIEICPTVMQPAIVDQNTPVEETAERLESLDNGKPQSSDALPDDEPHSPTRIRKPFECPVGGKKLKTPHLYQTQAQKAENPYVCSVCGHCFRNSIDFFKHKKNATGETPFSCTHCDFKFCGLIYFKRHVSTHERETFECMYCDHRYSTRNGYKVHLRTHTGKRPFKCDDGGQKFSCKSNLKNHQRTHTGEKP